MARRALRDCLIIAGLAILVVAGGRTVAAWHHRHAGPARLIVETSAPMTPPAADPRVLRVCADPNNLPFSNEKEEGFENAIARIVAEALNKHVEYYWQPQRRGFVRTTLNAGWCDMIPGVPADFDRALTTHPYYRSTYVFVSRRNSGVRIRSLNDPALRHLRIGVQITGEDYDNPPAVEALAARQIIDNVRGYMVYGDYSQPSPAREVIDAVANRNVDVAIAWGPLAGHFVRTAAVPMEIAPVAPEHDGAGLTFAFNIAMGVRRSDRALRDSLDRVVTARKEEIVSVLRQFGVPLLPIPGES
jgi:quinoprotein dehydrogenase-associated probable ABC transporter substrate-binding protein